MNQMFFDPKHRAVDAMIAVDELIDSGASIPRVQSFLSGALKDNSFGTKIVDYANVRMLIRELASEGGTNSNMDNCHRAQSAVAQFEGLRDSTTVQAETSRTVDEFFEVLDYFQNAPSREGTERLLNSLRNGEEEHDRRLLDFVEIGAMLNRARP